MKKTLATLVLYVYETYIQEDWDVYTKWGKRFIYPFWLLRIVYVTIASPVLALGYYWDNSEMKKLFQDAQLQSMVMMNQMMEQTNKK